MAMIRLFTALLAIGSTQAHMFIASPAPIPGTAPKTPLDPSGSNFPCHGVPLPGSGGQPMAVGSSQLLSFDTGSGANTAVHGGGSCQISITYETDPVKVRDPKNWYVLLSIEEGCPTNSPLNLDGTYTGANGQIYTGAYPCDESDNNGFDCVNSFHFEIPKGVKDGQATLAWTWFNNIGNREMYQNCVAVDITGGASDESQMQDFPGMFVANLASVNPGCSTTEGTNVAFPQPGAALQVKKPSPRADVASASNSYPVATPAGCPNMARNGSDVQPSLVPDSYPTAAATTAATTAPGTAPAMSAPAAESTDAPVDPARVPAPAPTSYVNDTSEAPAPSETGSESVPVGSCAAGSFACSTIGALVCPDSTHYGLCDVNLCAVSRPVAAGTQCKNGAITFADGFSKRDMAVRGHLHRHVKGLRRRY